MNPPRQSDYFPDPDGSRYAASVERWRLLCLERMRAATSRRGESFFAPETSYAAIRDAMRGEHT